MSEARDRCADCDRPLPAGWLAFKPCPFCQGGMDAADPSADAAHVAKGHPGVRVTPEGFTVVYQTRLGTVFGWIWLSFTSILLGLILLGLARGPGSRLELLGVLAFGLPFLLIGLAFTVATYRVRLAEDLVEVRWRIVGPIGWTWRLPAGEVVSVRMQARGAESNGRPELAVVVASQGKDIDFGAFLPMDRKAYLAAAIRNYYRG